MGWTLISVHAICWFTGEKLCNGRIKKKFQGLGLRTNFKPLNDVGHNRNRPIEEQFFHLLSPTTEVHLQVPHQVPNWMRSFDLARNVGIRPRYARPLARPPAPPHRQDWRSSAP